MVRTLWLTNDLPPGSGGIERFVAELARRVDPEHAVVLGPGHRDADAWDAAQPFAVLRRGGQVLPIPAVGRWVIDVARIHRPDAVVLGAAWPLGELAPRLRRALDVPVVALTHGLEAGLAQAGFGPLVGRAIRGLDAVTTISDWTEQVLAPSLGDVRVERVAPGVDVERFAPGRDVGSFAPGGDVGRFAPGGDVGRMSRGTSKGEMQRAWWGIPPGDPVVGCVSRLVRRKGQDRLVATWERVREHHPDAWLVIVGDGPLERRLRKDQRVRRSGSRIVITGAVDWEDLPGCYDALDVFAMPCRTRLGGTDVEGLGIVYLEAQACGVPVVAGDSGGAPEAVIDGETGTVVDGRDDGAIVGALNRWLSDDVARRRAGEIGRQWVTERWSWDAVASRFADVLTAVTSGDRRR